MDWKTCGRCNGKGAVPSIIENGRLFTCPSCGGHKVTPVEGDGHQWFIREGELPRIALLAPEPDGRWRVSLFDQSGPVTHQIEAGDEIMHEVRGFVMDDSAGELLDEWSLTSQWRDGVEAMTWLQLEFLLRPFIGWQHVCEMWKLPLEQRVHEGFVLKNVFAPHASIW